MSAIEVWNKIERAGFPVANVYSTTSSEYSRRVRVIKIQKNRAFGKYQTAEVVAMLKKSGYEVINSKEDSGEIVIPA